MYSTQRIVISEPHNGAVGRIAALQHQGQGFNLVLRLFVTVPGYVHFQQVPQFPPTI